MTTTPSNDSNLQEQQAYLTKLKEMQTSVQRLIKKAQDFLIKVEDRKEADKTLLDL